MKPRPPSRRTGRWLQEFRERHLREHPLCVRCSTDSSPVAATEVDHIVALDNGGKDFPEDPDNAQGLCAECHKDKTAQDLGHRRRPKVGLDGWPE
jgi:5-methylcytosine-specific restriction enzyme A